MCLWRAFLPPVLSVHSSWITCLFILFPSVLYKCDVGVQIGHWRVWCPVTLWGCDWLILSNIMFKQLLFNMPFSTSNLVLLMCNLHRTGAGIVHWRFVADSTWEIWQACCRTVLVAVVLFLVPTQNFSFSPFWLHLHSFVKVLCQNMTL
jgi:hypothetical protein